jgi:hypothetical protein
MKANATVQAQLNCGAQRGNAGLERLKCKLKKNYIVLLTAKQQTLFALSYNQPLKSADN